MTLHRDEESSPYMAVFDDDEVDVRVGRHRDKLELIRDSLRPFEQTVGDIVPVTAAEQNVQHSETHLTVVESATNSGALGQQRAMVDSLIAQGYDQDAAFYALKLVKFASTAAAVDVLKHINHDHANMEGKSVSLKLSGHFCFSLYV
uniref:UBA domain-containing protein n=1 Tax=Angiostrongylus cantonensis TaxID=6313 RepID=A0A0K0D3J4_ANGCA